MTVAAKGEPRRIWAVTIDSDWITTLSMAFLLAISASLLARELHDTLRGYIAEPGTLRITFNGILFRIGEVIAAIYCFMAGLGRVGGSKKFGNAERFAFALMAIYFTMGAALSVFRISLPAQHAAAVTRTVLVQVALIIFCVAIAGWFRSVFHWRANSERNGDTPEEPLS
jgi:hypothetical protein